MQKQKKQFAAVCGILAACIAVFFGLKYYNSQKAEAEAAKADSEVIKAAELAKETIDEFSYRYNGQDITFRKSDGTWYYKEDTSISIDQEQLASMLDTLASVTALQEITEPEDISQYGFSNPLSVITVKSDDETITFTVGMYNEITGQYYFMTSLSDSVYLIDGNFYSTFLVSVEDLTATEDTTSQNSISANE